MEIQKDLQDQIMKSTYEFHRNIMPLLTTEMQDAVRADVWFNIEVVSSGPSVKLITTRKTFDISDVWKSVYKKYKKY